MSKHLWWIIALCLMWPVSHGTAAAQAPAEPSHAEPEHAAGEPEPAGEGSEETHEADHGAGHGAHIGAEGVSKDPTEFRSDLAIYTFIVFLLLLTILGKFAWGPITAALDAREAGIHANIAAAEEARKKAEAMLAEHEARLDKVQDEVREIIAEARRDADHTRQDITNEAQKEADATRQRALRDIERARDAALKEMFDSLGKHVAEATEHVLGRSLNGGDQDRLINEALAQIAEK